MQSEYIVNITNMYIAKYRAKLVRSARNIKSDIKILKQKIKY